MKCARLTLNQTRVYDYIKVYVKKQGYSPTLTEISEDLSLPIASVYRRLEELQTAGKITRTPRIARSMQLVEG